MIKSPRRSFTLLDTIVLIAATALGCRWLASVIDLESFKGLEEMLPFVPKIVSPILATWTVAIAALRLLPPRPPLRRLVLQPGAAVCGSITCLIALETFGYIAINFIESRSILWSLVRLGGDWGVELYGFAIRREQYPIVIATAWGLLFLSRRWRPERSWIDRTGRAIGLLWLLEEFLEMSILFIDLWTVPAE